MTSFLSTHLEAFTNEMEMIAFKFKINGNLYEITFGKNGSSDLAVSNLAEIKQ